MDASNVVDDIDTDSDEYLDVEGDCDVNNENESDKAGIFEDSIVKSIERVNGKIYNMDDAIDTKVNDVVDEQQKDITPLYKTVENKRSDSCNFKNVNNEKDSKNVFMDSKVILKESENISKAMFKTQNISNIRSRDEIVSVGMVQNCDTVNVISSSTAASKVSSNSEDVHIENSDSLQANEKIGSAGESKGRLDDIDCNKSNINSHKSEEGTFVDELHISVNTKNDSVTGQVIEDFRTDDDEQSDLERLIINLDENLVEKSCELSMLNHSDLQSSKLKKAKVSNTNVVSAKSKKRKQSSSYDTDLSNTINRNKKKKEHNLQIDTGLTENIHKNLVEKVYLKPIVVDFTNIVDVNGKNKAAVVTEDINMTESMADDASKKLNIESMICVQDKKMAKDKIKLANSDDGNKREKSNDIDGNHNLSSEKESEEPEKHIYHIDAIINDASFNLSSLEKCTEETMQSSSSLGASEICISSEIAEQFSKRLLSSIQTTFDEMCAEMIKEHAQTPNNDDFSKQLEQSCWDAEKEQLITNVRAKCQAEKEIALWDAKKKQWCAYCGKEALFYCCWNANYCDYPCQQNHWPQHVLTCLQTINMANKNTAAISNSTMMPGQSTQSHMLVVSQSQAVAVMSPCQSSRSQSSSVQVNSPPFGVPVSMAPRMVFTMQSDMMQPIKKTVFVSQPAVVTGRKLPLHRGSLSQARQVNPRMVFNRPLVQHTMYPLQVHPEQQLRGAIFFQNPRQQNMMTYGRPRPF